MHSLSLRMLLLAGISVASLAVSACSDPHREEDGYIAHELLAHAVLLTVSEVPENLATSPITARLLLDQSRGEEGTVTLLAYGAETEGTYELDGDTLSVTFPATEPLEERLPTSAGACPDVLDPETLTMTLTITRDGGSAIALQGTASGSVSHWLDDDAPWWKPRMFSVTGVLESEAPVVLANSEGLHPLDAVEAYVGGRVLGESFPLMQSGADVAFDTMVFAPIRRPSVSREFFVYRRMGDRPLPWGATFSIVPAGLGGDSLNRPIRAASFTTAPAPASFDTPDFEGPVHVLLSGGARLSSAADVGFAAPEEGAQALSLSSNGSATFVFSEPQGAAPTSLVMRVRYRTESYLPYDVPETLGVAFFDEAEVVSVLADPDPGFITDGIDTVAGTAIATLTVPLPDLARAGAFSLSVGTSHSGSCGGLPQPRGEAVIEELRLE